MPNTLTVVNMPTDSELRNAINLLVVQRYGSRGVRAFAKDAGLPYDRVRDHLTGSTNWKVVDLLAYMNALGVTFEDLFKITEAAQLLAPCGAEHPTE